MVWNRKQLRRALSASLCASLVWSAASSGTAIGQQWSEPCDQAVPCDDQACDADRCDALLAASGAGAFEDKAFGDLGGLRTLMAEHGITMNLSATQFFQGMAAGGRDYDWPYGGKLDYLVDIDGEKLGLQQGFFVNMHAESRIGESVNTIDGLLLPANVAMNFPDAEDDVTSITGLKLTQALSENFALYAGKLNTLDDFGLRYIGGPGLGGFMNSSLVFNPIVARVVPYSAAGGGFAILQDLQPLFTLTVLDPEERATDGLEDLFERGVTIVPDLTLRTEMAGLPGIYNFGGAYSNSDYTSLERSAWLNYPVTLASPTENESWSLYSNFYQSLMVDRCNKNRGWGVFGLFGISDGNPNPIKYVANIGIGGTNLSNARRNDRFGAGFFFVGLSDEVKTLTANVLAQENEYGTEYFYNYEINPWCRLTADIQVVNPSTRSFDAALIPGVRLQTIF